MTEAEIERRVVHFCRQNCLLTYKFTSPAHRGVPDRIIMAGGKVLFLELKQAGKQPTPLQMREMENINAHSACDEVVATWAAGLDAALVAIRKVFYL